MDLLQVSKEINTELTQISLYYRDVLDQQEAVAIFNSRLYSGSGMGSHGSSRRRKLCKAQPISITISRIPVIRRRQTSLRMRRRLTLLLTCSIPTRRRAFA